MKWEITTDINFRESLITSLKPLLLYKLCCGHHYHYTLLLIFVIYHCITSVSNNSKTQQKVHFEFNNVITAVLSCNRLHYIRCSSLSHRRLKREICFRVFIVHTKRNVLIYITMYKYTVSKGHLNKNIEVCFTQSVKWKYSVCIMARFKVFIVNYLIP